VKPSPYDSPDYWSIIRRVRDIDRAGDDSGVPRLIAADWLEDHGEAERAMFARIQVRYAEIHNDDTPERDELSDLQQTRFIICRGIPTWFAPDCPNRMWPDQCHRGTPREWDWYRGWISAVRTPLDWWLAHGPDLCRRHPVMEVTVTDAFGHVGARVHANYSVGRFLVRGRIPGTQDDNEYQSDADAVSALNAHALRWAESETDRTPGDPP